MALRHPIYGLLTYVGVFYLHPPSRWWGQGILLEVRWVLVAAAVTVIAMLIHWKKLSPAPLLRSGLFWGLLLFVAWLAIQSLWVIDPISHADLLSIYFKFVIL